MKCYSKVGLVLLASLFNLTTCTFQEILGTFLKEFIEHENVPTTISIMECGPKKSLVKIAKTTKLSVVGNPIELFESLKDLTVKRNDILTVVDLDCPSARNYLSQIHPNLMSHPMRWILMAKNFTFDDQRIVLENLPLRLDSNVVIAEITNSSSVSLQTIYRIDREMGIFYEDYGAWSFLDGIKDVRLTRVLCRRRMNLHGKHFPASLVITDNNTLAHLTDLGGERDIDLITKVNYGLSNHVMDTMNVTREFVIVSTYGVLNKTTGTWDGMMRDLIAEKTEFGATPLFLTQNRVGVIDYASMVNPTYGAFVFRAPPLSYVSNIFYLPFHDTVWISGFALVILITIIFFFVWRVGIWYRTDIPAREIPRFSDIIMNAAGAITQQGAHMPAKITSGRIVSFFQFLSMFFLYTAYTANIVALLQSTTNSISTLTLLRDSNFELAVDDIIYNRFYFKIVDEPVRKSIYETKIAPPGKKDKFMPKREGIAKMRKGLFAFYMEVGAGYTIIEETFYEHEKCGLMEIQFLQFPYPWAPIKKNSPYREIIKTQFFRVREHGLQSREVDRFYGRKPKCASNGNNFESVRLIDCYVIILIIACGYSIALIVFFVEILTKLCNSSATKVICAL